MADLALGSAATSSPELPPTQSIDDGSASRRPTSTKASDDLADDLVPIALAAIPTVIVVIMLGLVAQPAVFNALVQDGQVISLTLGLLPSFAPLLLGLLTYLLLRRWTKQNRRVGAVQASVVFVVVALLVPVSLLIGQLGLVAFAYALVAKKDGTTRKRWLHRSISAGIALSLMTGALVAGASRSSGGHESPSGWSSAVPRALVGRAIAGLDRENVIIAGRAQSVAIVNRTDDPAIVITSGYPPIVESVPADVIKTGTICQLPESSLQLSVLSLLDRYAGSGDRNRTGTPACLPPT